MFGTAVELNADAIGFPSDAKEYPLANADPYLCELLMRYCKEALAARDSIASTLRSQVENVLAPLLPHGAPNARQVATKLGMSYRTLARRLASENQGFARILADLRADLAARYLKIPPSRSRRPPGCSVMRRRAVSRTQSRSERAGRRNNCDCIQTFGSRAHSARGQVAAAAAFSNAE